MRYVLSTLLLRKLCISGTMYLNKDKEGLAFMQINLRQILDKKNKSIYWLSNSTGIAASTLSNLCNHKTTAIQFSVLDKICESLDCDVSDILIAESTQRRRLLRYADELNKVKTKGDAN